ncbi:hypothetical protein [Nonomuraea sp. CA-141351]|uniref:hypothetical protein n=1 Tax=Nonomuraea sp. CA-141351 TaxID=3239996 RepID=UPI003D8B8CB2
MPLGTSDSGLRAKGETEQAIARGEVHIEMIEAHQHTDLAGPSARGDLHSRVEITLSHAVG